MTQPTLDDLAAMVPHGEARAPRGLCRRLHGHDPAAHRAGPARPSRRLPANRRHAARHADRRGLRRHHRDQRHDARRGGGAPCFTRPVREGSVKVMDATCPAVHAGFLAAQKGVPFATLRGMIGTDLLANRPDWKVIQNPSPTSRIRSSPSPPSGRMWRSSTAPWPIATAMSGSAAAASSPASPMPPSAPSSPSSASSRRASGRRGDRGGRPARALCRGRRGGEEWRGPDRLWGEYPADMEAIGRYAREARTPEGFRAFLDGADRLLEAV